ncbi:MAG: MotA/TolQ/ExbB proton channel family protein [Planctomycetota bacterium]
MPSIPLPLPSVPALQGAAPDPKSVLELLASGGPLMIPIGVCSVVALAYTVERWVRLQPSLLGSKRFGREVTSTVEASGPEAALALARGKRSPLARILTLALERVDDPFLEREKAVDDLAAAEIKRLARNLRPLLVVYLIAPLLGLLGTVWGMIEAFGELAVGGAGKPELLASGIYQALTTTAAGLAVAIPAVVGYQYLRGRIEGFARRTEDHLRALDAALRACPASAVAAAVPQPAPAVEPTASETPEAAASPSPAGA